MKKLKAITALSLTAMMALPVFAGCTAGENPSGGGKTSIEFWGWADAYESEIYQGMVDTFNSSQDEIWVNYTKKPGGDYERAVVQALGSRSAPDIFYVPEELIKTWVSQDLIHDITPQVKNSKKIDLTDMWDSLNGRYQFDPDTFKYAEDAPIWGLSKDLGVTAIYYNADAMESVGIEVISVAKDEITDPAEQHGFYKKNGKYYFNNRISMTWEELIECSKLLTRDYNENSPTKYGYYDSNWFNTVWTVGGDCLEWVESDSASYKGGYYEWILDSNEPNNINGKTMPSNLEAINLWVSYSLGNNSKYGLTAPISPIPTVVTDQYNMFTTGQIAMYVIPRYAVPTFRRDCDFNWDAAPMPMHKDGVQASYTTSMAYSIAKNSTKKDAAFKFMEYMSGPEGQAELAKYGFNVPNQKSVSNSDAFLVSQEPPYNNIIFAEGAAYQTVGDWMYLPDTAWIDFIESPINDVRNGRKTFVDMAAAVKGELNEYLKRYTQKK